MLCLILLFFLVFHLLEKQNNPEKMGLNSSTNVTRTINENTNKSTINSIQSITSNNSQSASIDQSITIVIDGNVTCASFTLSNDAKINVSALSQSTATQRNEMSQAVTQALAVQAKSQVEQANKDIPIGDVNLSFVINEAINKTTQEQTANLEQAFVNTVSQTSNISQAITLIVGPTANLVVAGDCKFSNTSSIEYVSQIVTNAAMDTVLGQESVQNAMAEWDSYVKQTNTGLSIGAIVGIVIGVLALIVIIAVGAYYGDKKRKTGHF